MKKLNEILSTIESFNNAVVVNFVTFDNHTEVIFKASLFALEGIKREVNESIYNTFESNVYRLTFYF